MAFGWALSLILFMFFDVWYVVHAVILTIVCSVKKLIKRQHILDEVRYYAICLSTDLDLYGHMNNSRYLRECDFGRYQLWLQNGIFNAVRSLGGTVTLGGSTIRFRKSLNLFDTYVIVSKVVCWDDKAFYVDQRFVRRKDNFIMAMALFKQSLKGISPADVLQEVEGTEIESPEFPKYVQKWIEHNELSRELLKKEQ